MCRASVPFPKNHNVGHGRSAWGVNRAGMVVVPCPHPSTRWCHAALPRASERSYWQAPRRIFRRPHVIGTERGTPVRSALTEHPVMSRGAAGASHVDGHTLHQSATTQSAARAPSPQGNVALRGGSSDFRREGSRSGFRRLHRPSAAGTRRRWLLRPRLRGST
jgi:hypothetical protein